MAAVRNTTQSKHPVRAAFRTAFQVLLGLAIVVPLVLAELGLEEAAIGGVSVLAVCAGITRVMAIPQVEAFLQRWLPWLAAEPRE